MAGWRYFAERLNGDGTSTLIHPDVPLRKPMIEDALTAHGGMTAVVAPEMLSMKGSDGGPLFDEWSTALYAEKDGDIRGGGILTHSSFKDSEWSLECTGFSGYLGEMPYTGPGAHWEYTDTLDIVRAIWAHVQSQEGSNLGVELDDLKSGVLVGRELASEEYDPEGGDGGLTLQSQAYKLAWYEHHDLSSNVNDLAGETPFDFRNRLFFDPSGETVRKRIEFGVPKIGRRREELRFAIGENIYTRPEVARAGADYASEVIALGAGTGSTTLRGSAFTPRHRRLRRPKVISSPGMQHQWQVNHAAESDLKWRQTLDDVSDLVVRDHPNARLGSFDIGDEIYLQGDLGWVELDAWYRILSQTVDPEAPEAIGLTIARTDRVPQ